MIKIEIRKGIEAIIKIKIIINQNSRRKGLGDLKNIHMELPEMKSSP